MIKKKFRLKGEDLKNFFKIKFSKIKTPDFLIYFQRNNLSHPRFSVICKKESFKKAVLRNKIKRKIYAIIRELLKEGEIKNYDYLIFPQKEEINLNSFLEILKKINV